MDDKKLKIVLLGFDWNDIGTTRPDITMRKLNRDGLRTDMNEFVLIYAGNETGQKIVRKEPYFSMWHFSFFTRLRVIYDFLFVIYLPVVLLFERFKPDIFYLTDFPHFLSVFIPAKLCGAKIYFRLVNLPVELALVKGERGKWHSRYYRLMEKISIPFIDQFIVINETTKNYLRERGVGDWKIIEDIPDTINCDSEFIERVDKNHIRRKHNIPLGKKIILSVGSLIREKGFYELIETFAKLNNSGLVLIICGVGSEKEGLTKSAEEKGVADRVVFAGSVERDEIWHYYAGADIFMLFSKSESLGMVFWEAMHMGLPVIGAPVGGMKETIGNDGERGFFWKGDQEDLKNKINFCLNDENKKERDEMLARAKNYVKEKLKLKKTINNIYNAL